VFNGEQIDVSLVENWICHRRQSCWKHPHK